ncbi:MAG TPA: GH3 auxin-responsive promoter family protein, partial [Phycisphaerales bacterium]|nr:GH3 auxin-responsive promoter family protein [Phycisphaerales bacterium]
MNRSSQPPKQPGHKRWTSLVGLGLKARLRRRVARLSDTRYWQENTARIQAVQLRRLLRYAAETEFGRGRGFARLAELPESEIVAAYRKATPIADYAAFRGLVARMREGGERDVLWPGLVRDFAQTSGTTAGDKYIPVSRQMLRSNFRAAMDIFANARRFGVDPSRLLGGKALFLGG